MPKLLSINNYYYLRGGAEAVYLRHNALFTAMGWDVAPFSMKHPNNINSEWADYFVDEIELGSPYSFWGKLKRAQKVIYSFEARRKISRLLETFQADICHAHNIYHHISPSILSEIKNHHLPVVMTLHDLKIACPAYNMLSNGRICEGCRSGRIYNVLLQRCIKGSVSLSAVVMAEALVHRVLDSYGSYVDRFVVPSLFYIQKLTEWGWDKNRFVYVPNFVELSSYQPNFSPGSYFLYFGRLSREKGLRTLIHAAAIAGVHLKVVGAGPDEEFLRRLAVNLGAKVEFLGFQSGGALHDIVRASRAVVLPSEWYENAPMSILESYALGKSIIGADIGGITELIRNEETGVTFRSGSADELADRMRRFMIAPSDRIIEMGENARSWVGSYFSHDQYRDRMLALYRELGVAC